jgi:predicted MFS family arabinose efflux permease
MLLAGSYGGLIVDRFPKRRILYGTQTSAGLLALLLGVLVTTHNVTVGRVYTIALLLGIVNMFDMPARQAFVQEMVGRDLVANAVSLNSVLMNSGRLIGPAIAASVIAAFGTAMCFYTNALSYVAVLIALAFMRRSEFVPLRRVTREPGQLRRGLRYVRETPVLFDTLMAVAVIGTFAFNFTTTLPLLARVTFHQHNAKTYGFLLGAMGLGAVFGGLYVSWRSRPTPRLLTVLALGFGIAMTVASLAPTPLFAEIAMVPLGAFAIAFISTGNATMQTNSNQEMRGRVMSLYGIAFLGTTPIGAPLIGILVSATNPRIGLLFGAVVTVITGLWLVYRLRRSATCQEN